MSLIHYESLGGGSVGLMGTIAKAVLDNGGQALSIVPEPLFKHGSKQLCETIIVPDMHSRKKRMADEVMNALIKKEANQNRVMPLLYSQVDLVPWKKCWKWSLGHNSIFTQSLSFYSTPRIFSIFIFSGFNWLLKVIWDGSQRDYKQFL